MIRKLLTVLALLCFAVVSVVSKSVNLDSLKTQLGRENSPELISSLCLFGECLLDSIPDQSLIYFNQAMNLADSMNDIQGKQKAFYSLGNFYKSTGNLVNAKQNYDSSIKYLSQPDWINKALIFIGYGEIYYEKLQYDSALMILESAKRIAEKQKAPAILSAIYNNLARTKDKLGKREEATEYYIKAAEKFAELKDKKNLAVAYNNIGTINLSFKNYQHALHYFFEALSLNTKSGSRLNLSMIYSNIGVAYYKSDSLEKAEFYYKKSLDLLKQSGNEPEKARAYMNLANLYSHQKKFEPAIRYYDSSLNLCLENGIEYGVLLNKINLGELHYNLGNYKLAADYMENAKKLLLDYSLPEEEMELYRMLYKTYLKLGNDSKALKSLEKHYTLRDSIAGEKKNKVLLELQARYENEKSQKELMELQKEKLTEEAEHRAILIMFLILFLLLLSIIFFIFTQRRKAIYQKSIIEKDKMILESKMNTKDKELANFAMHLAKTYEINENVSTQIKNILPVADKIKTEKLKRIVDDLDSAASTDVWKEFELRFEQVHKDFFYVLKELHPELSPVELKVCSLLRLNMSSKDISALTNRSVRTVENTRTTIRKKLKLNPQTNLSSYLLSI